MARRGTPLAIALRDEAKRLRKDSLSFRKIAARLGISHNTAKKYAERV